MDSSTMRYRLSRAWPWLLLIGLIVPPVWHWLDFPEDIDPEYPAVTRPTCLEFGSTGSASSSSGVMTRILIDG